MKTPLFLLLAIVGFFVADRAIASTDRPSALSVPSLYVTIDAADPVAFDRTQNARENGQELILSTLKSEAATQAKFAHLGRPVVVLDDGARPPADSAELRLTWMDSAVTADFYNGHDVKPKFIGVVNRTSIAFHPNQRAMQEELRSESMPDSKHDAELRTNLEMMLYVSFERVARELAEEK